MDSGLWSVLTGLVALGIGMLAALLLTILRNTGNLDASARDGLARLFLVGIALQCAHFGEEYLTRFYERFPQFLGLSAWSGEFFVTFNLFWIAIWVLSVIGLSINFRPAFFPIWFFAIGMTMNAVGHPLLALATRGYFPGLLTSPLAGILGLALIVRLWAMTGATSARVASGSLS